MNKILIFYGSYGGGHLSAAKSIKSYIEENYKNSQIEMIDCVEYVNKVLNKLTTKAYKDMAKKAPWAWKRVYSSSNSGILSKVSNLSNKLMASKLNKLISSFEPSLIISTHPFSSQMCAILKRQQKLNCKVATIMTDFHIHNQWIIGSEYIDYYFVSNNTMKKDLINKNIDENKIFVTGIPLSERFLLNYNREEILSAFGLAENRKTILFFGGGEFGLGKTRTFEIFNTLVESFGEFQMIAVAGRNEEMKNAFSNLVNEKNKEDSVKVLEFTKQVPELMSISDVVITKPGGLTTTESLASGLPIIVINPIPGQEEENAMFLENSGAAVWVKKDSNIKDVLDSVLLSSEKLEKMKEASLLLARPHSTSDICKTLLGN